MLIYSRKSFDRSYSGTLCTTTLLSFLSPPKVKKGDRKNGERLVQKVADYDLLLLHNNVISDQDK